MNQSPFDHRPDPELGALLRAGLSAPDEAEFVERVLLRASEFPVGTVNGDWWEVLGRWAKPGVAAAAASLAAVLVLWFTSTLSAPESPVALSDPLVPVDELLAPVALLASSQPPDLNEVLAASLRAEGQ